MSEGNGLLQLASFIAEIAHITHNVSDLVDTIEAKNLGEKIVETVKEHHGDPTKINPPLSPDYEAWKTAQGGPANSPLLWDGELRDSYDCRIGSDPSGEGKAIIIGSPNDKALWHELGFYNVRANVAVPARPVLLPSVMEHEVDIKKWAEMTMVGLWGKAAVTYFGSFARLNKL